MTEFVQVNLRLTEYLKERLQHAADVGGRSFNAEVVWRLEDTFDEEAKAKVREEKEKQDQLMLRELVSTVNTLSATVSALQIRVAASGERVAAYGEQVAAHGERIRALRSSKKGDKK
jgi:hypothetical protein